MTSKQFNKSEKCEHCEATEELTLDHIIPHWFLKRVAYILSDRKVRKQFMLTGKKRVYRYQTLCKKCNMEKGGYFDFSDEKVRTYIRLFICALETELMKYPKDTE